eukprot:1138627-Pelagomonas_calceolata.AAC.6
MSVQKCVQGNKILRFLMHACAVCVCARVCACKVGALNQAKQILVLTVVCIQSMSTPAAGTHASRLEEQARPKV